MRINFVLSTALLCAAAVGVVAAAPKAPVAQDYSLLADKYLTDFALTPQRINCIQSIEKVKDITKVALNAKIPDQTLTCADYAKACNACSKCVDFNDGSFPMGPRYCVCATSNTPSSLTLGTNDDCFISLTQEWGGSVDAGDNDDCLIVANTATLSSVAGGAGDDTILLVADGIHHGSALMGVDSVNGNDGEDCIYWAMEFPSFGLDLSAGVGNDFIYIDTDREQNLGVDFGGTQQVFHAGSGDDLIIAGGAGIKANVDLFGGDGNDVLRLEKGQFNDVSGNGGDDDIYIFGNAYVADVYGDAGNDIFNVNGNAYVDTIDGGAGDDVITINAGYLHHIHGYYGQDHIVVNDKGFVRKIFGGHDDDTIIVNTGGSVSDIYGDSGTYITNFIGDDFIDINGGYVFGTVYGEDGDDTIVVEKGGFARNVLGGYANDIINISAFAQFVKGGYGEDKLYVTKNGAVYNYVAGFYYSYYLPTNYDPDFFSIDGRVGYVTGADGPDTIFIGPDARVNGIYPAGGDDNIEIQGLVAGAVGAGSGDDYVHVKENGEVRGGIFGGDDSDTLVVSGKVNGLFGGYGNDNCEFKNYHQGADCENVVV